MSDPANLQLQATEYGATRIIGVMPQKGLTIDSPQGPRLTPKLDQTFKPAYTPPHKPYPVPLSDYRFPSMALPGMPGDKRSGVIIKADVVKGERADTSELFGGGASAQTAATGQEELFSPFLLFCAMAESKRWGPGTKILQNSHQLSYPKAEQ
jgi:hypothetical protein